MATLIELAAQLVNTRAAQTPMTSDEMLVEIRKVHQSLKSIENGTPISTEATTGTDAAPEVPQISLKKAFGKTEVTCMICGKGGFKTLARHLSTAHNMKPSDYRKQFGIPTKQSLSARNYSESRRKMAQDRGLADNLAKAREVRMANIEAKKQKTSGKAKKAAGATPAPAPKAAKAVKQPKAASAA